MPVPLWPRAHFGNSRAEIAIGASREHACHGPRRSRFDVDRYRLDRAQHLDDAPFTGHKQGPRDMPATHRSATLGALAVLDSTCSLGFALQRHSGMSCNHRRESRRSLDLHSIIHMRSHLGSSMQRSFGSGWISCRRSIVVGPVRGSATRASVQRGGIIRDRPLSRIGVRERMHAEISRLVGENMRTIQRLPPLWQTRSLLYLTPAALCWKFATLMS